jgi:hypothetical protein
MALISHYQTGCSQSIPTLNTTPSMSTIQPTLQQVNSLITVAQFPQSIDSTNTGNGFADQNSTMWYIEKSSSTTSTPTSNFILLAPENQTRR